MQYLRVRGRGRAGGQSLLYLHHFDATACCSQGIEFVLAGDTGAEAYPPVDTEITVTGTFQTYDENGILYCHLVDATLE